MSGAVSMILFYLFLDVANGETTSTVEFTFQAVRLTLGGVIVGLLFGFVVSIWMKRIILFGLDEKAGLGLKSIGF